MSEWDAGIPRESSGWGAPDYEADFLDLTIIRSDRSAAPPHAEEQPIVAAAHRQDADGPAEVNPETPARPAPDTEGGAAPAEAPRAPKAVQQRHETEELRALREQVERRSGADYTRAALAPRQKIVDTTRKALKQRDAYKATTCVMALQERQENHDLAQMWPWVAPMAIGAAHDRIDDIAGGAGTMGEVLLINNLIPNAFKTPDLREKSADLQAALRESSLGAYDLSDLPRPEAADARAAQEAAIRAGFVHQRLRAGGPPVLRDEEQALRFAKLDARRDRRLWDACMQTDPSALPDPILRELHRIGQRYESQRDAARTSRIREFLGHTVDYVIKHGLTEITNHRWHR